jgi:23S rRNA (cytosine1962-C5)-methyltransferase
VTKSLLERLEAAVARREAVGLPNTSTNAYRLVHGEADSLPGFTVDVYDRFLLVSSYIAGARAQQEEQEFLDALATLSFEGIYLKRRPKQANVLGDGERKDRAPERAVRGRDAPDEFAIVESQMKFLVRLGDGLSTGLFLDQRANRAQVRASAAGLRVLNLFAYTTAFGAAAALGGARETLNIDLSKAALERGKRNYQLNGLELTNHRFYARDVLQELPKLARRDERFDLVIVDPPSYARGRHGRFTVEGSFEALLVSALGLLSPGGTVFASTNHAGLSVAAFERMLRSAAGRVGGRAQITLRTLPPDYPLGTGEEPYLKCAWIGLS